MRDNGNYVWISYFYSYLSERGRAGFVMSSQASSAGGGEAKVRQKLVETGDVDLMIAIRSNFFYTRTVPCELWFLNRNKRAEHRDKVLMLDAEAEAEYEKIMEEFPNESGPYLYFDDSRQVLRGASLRLAKGEIVDFANTRGGQHHVLHGQVPRQGTARFERVDVLVAVETQRADFFRHSCSS